MIKIDKNVVIDPESMTVDELIAEVTASVSNNTQAMNTFMWQLYGLLKVGTCFTADSDIGEVSKLWYTMDAFEIQVSKIQVTPPGVGENSVVKLCPKIGKGESVMFLGMSEIEYDHTRIEYRGWPPRSKTINVIHTDSRKYPKWIIGEKVVTWPLDLGLFRIAAPGSGKKVADTNE